MKLKCINVMQISLLLTVLGITTFFGFQASAYTFSEAMEFKSITPDVLKVYTGTQTVQALMNAFDAEYSRSHLSTTISVSGGKFSRLTTTQADAKYPRAAWLQLLLEKGITIKNFREYASYLSKRHTLVFLEENPDLWKSGFLGIQPMDDWETYKATYITNRTYAIVYKCGILSTYENPNPLRKEATVIFRLLSVSVGEFP